jgi:hypothetical protein
MGKTNRRNNEDGSEYAREDEVMVTVYRVQGVWDGYRISEPSHGFVHTDLDEAIERARDYACNVLSHASEAQELGKALPAVRVLDSNTSKIVWHWESPVLDLTN